MKKKLDFAMKYNTTYYFSNDLITQFSLQDKKGKLIFVGSNILRFDIAGQTITINKLNIEGNLADSFSEYPFFSSENTVLLHTTKTGYQQLIENTTDETEKEAVDTAVQTERDEIEQNKEDTKETIEANTPDVTTDDGNKLDWF